MMNSTSFKYIFILLALNFSTGKCARILAVFPSPGYSQYILAEPLLIALAGRGHNVTTISAFKTKNVTNLRNIVVDVSGGDDVPPELLYQLQDFSIFTNIIFLSDLGLDISENLLADKKVQELLHSNEHFDLVIVETFINEAHQAFAKHFDAHQVLLHSAAISEWNSHLVANPNIPSYLPNSFGGYTTHMDFGQRFRNTIVLWFDRMYKYFVQYPAHQKLVDKYFPGKHNLNEVIYNASLMLACSHVSTSEALPLTTSIVEVGGMHIVNKPLPDNIKDFLDSATNGAIFFSMGSNVRSSSMPRGLIREILTMFGKLKQKVLWKFEAGVIDNKPDNVMVSKWFPQNDILDHPNTVLFLSHCGMGSITEAIYHGVPVVGIPIYGDQFMNVRKLVLFGMGLELPLKELSGKTLKESITKILSDSMYTDNAKKRSSILRDRPMKPLDLAVYWIEYILRHNGGHHLKNSIFNLTWYQLYLFDIIGVLLVIPPCIIFILFVLTRPVGSQTATKTKNE